jgi:hypothetical protein
MLHISGPVILVNSGQDLLDIFVFILVLNPGRRWSLIRGSSLLDILVVVVVGETYNLNITIIRI